MDEKSNYETRTNNVNYKTILTDLISGTHSQEVQLFKREKSNDNLSLSDGLLKPKNKTFSNYSSRGFYKQSTSRSKSTPKPTDLFKKRKKSKPKRLHKNKVERSNKKRKS